MKAAPRPLAAAELAIIGQAGGVHLVRLRGWRLRLAAFVLAILAGVQ